MKTYGDLNLRRIREKCDLDFAHYTYQPGMCSCCFGPKDLPPMYWKNRTIPTHDDYTYVLFKNADNGAGHVTKKDEIKNFTCIEHYFRDDTQKELFCRLLLEQLGEEYVVCVPRRNTDCVIIYTQRGYARMMELDGEATNKHFYAIGANEAE